MFLRRSAAHLRSRNGRTVEGDLDRRRYRLVFVPVDPATRPGVRQANITSPHIGCVVSSSPVYDLRQADSGARLVGVVTATNEYGQTASASTGIATFPTLDLTAPVITNLRGRLLGHVFDALVSLSKPAELTITLSRPTRTVPCTMFLTVTGRTGNCTDWTQVTSRALPDGQFTRGRPGRP